MLRIGVGDGGSDTYDWALLMPLQGNGGGDYQGQNVWAFGGEARTNNGFSNTVTISAMCGMLKQNRDIVMPYHFAWVNDVTYLLASLSAPAFAGV